MYRNLKFTLIAAVLAVSACATVNNLDASNTSAGGGSYKAQAINESTSREDRYKPRVKVSKEQIERHIRDLFADSKVVSSNTRLESVAWAVENLKFANRQYTADSQVWAVTVEGDLDWPLAVGVGQDRAKGRQMQLTFATDTGALLAAFMPN